jgi:hypothetical protein
LINRCLFPLLALAIPSAAAAQKNCSPCKLDITPVVTLGTQSGIGELTELTAITRDRSGRYWVAAANGQEIAIFDASGKPAKRIGRKGKGPGEYQFISMMTAVGDEIHVFDDRNATLTVLNSNGRVIRTMAMPTVLAAAHTTNGSLVVNSLIRTRDKVWSPLHVLNSKGAVVRSFGEQGEAFRSDIPFSGHRRIAPSSRGGVWSAMVTRYEIERWADNGSRQQIIAPRTEWFRPHTSTPSFTPEEPPLPILAAIREHRPRYLLAMISVADAQWKSSLRPAKTTSHELTHAPTSLNDYFDTLVEAIDIETGKRVASRRMDVFSSRFVDSDHLASYSEYGEGIPGVTIWRVQLQTGRNTN